MEFCLQMREAACEFQIEIVDERKKKKKKSRKHRKIFIQ